MKTQLFYNEIENIIIVNISSARKSIKIAMAWFTNPRIYQLLAEQKKEGLDIQLILSNDKLNFINPRINFQNFIDIGIEIRINKSNNLMHNKFCIIDDKRLLNGSYNWTVKAEKSNFENIILTTDILLINDFIDYFNILKEKTNKVEKISKIKFSTNISEIEEGVELDFLEKKIVKKDSIQNKEIKYTLEMAKAIEEAELLYLNVKHEDCIIFCSKMINDYPSVFEFYLIQAGSFWRLKRFEDLIISSDKAISINNKLYQAYNYLGIGYSKIGKEQKSIDNFTICIKEFPNEHTFYRNRAISYMDLENEVNLPNKFRQKYNEKANIDLEKIIEIVDAISEKNLTYGATHSKAFAYFSLGKLKYAKKYIDLSIKLFREEKNKLKKDKNELISMKELLKDIKTYQKR